MIPPGVSSTNSGSDTSSTSAVINRTIASVFARCASTLASCTFYQVAAQEAVDRDAAPLTQQIALAQATATDLDNRIAQLDAMMKGATARGYTRTAMILVGRQSASRAVLVAERQQAAERLADLKVKPTSMHSASL